MSEPYVVLHGGFHKTATSHIQSTLGRNENMLRKKGVSYIHHRETRKELTVPCQLYVYEQQGLNYRTKYTDAELAEKTGAFFAEVLKDDPKRLILSEENMAGHCGHCVKRGLLYVWRDQLIETFARQFPVPVKEVHLGIRNYADFFASAYIEYLRSLGPGRFIDEPTMRKRVLEHMPSWHKALKAVMVAFPQASLTVWTFEDFRHLDTRVLANLIGPEIDVGKLKPPNNKNKRPSASGRAVAELLQLIHREGVESAMAQRVELQEKFPRGPEFGGYDPWTPRERAHLSKIYERDIEAIRNDPDIEMLNVEYA